jgi:hypothetical protein
MAERFIPSGEFELEASAPPSTASSSVMAAMAIAPSFGAGIHDRIRFDVNRIGIDRFKLICCSAPGPN